MQPISKVEFVPELHRNDSWHQLEIYEEDFDFYQLIEVVDSLPIPAITDTDGRIIQLASIIASVWGDVQKIYNPNLLSGWLISVVNAVVMSKKPFVFVLSLFPCKGTHPLRTFAKTGAEIDLGETLAILRAYYALRAIQSVYDPGAKLIILSNGRRYLDVFFEYNSDVEGYRRNIRELIAFFCLNDCIELLSEEDFYPQTMSEDLREMESQIGFELYKNTDQYADLLRNVRLNIKVPVKLEPWKFAEIIYKGNIKASSLSSRQMEAIEFLDEHVDNSARRYIAINKLLQDYEIVKSNWPEAIHLTVHPKPDHLKFIPSFSEGVFPHNGQAVTHGSAYSLDQVKIEYAANILRRSAVCGISPPQSKYKFLTNTHPFLVKQVLSAR